MFNSLNYLQKQQPLVLLSGKFQNQLFKINHDNLFIV